MTYRVEFGGGAQVQFHTLPAHAREALIERAVELSEQPWDAVIRPPGDDPKFRETTFGFGSGIVGFYVDEEARRNAPSPHRQHSDQAGEAPGGMQGTVHRSYVRRSSKGT